MTFIFVGWPVIFVVIVVISAVIGDAVTSPAAFGLVLVMTVLAGIFAVISGFGGIFACWTSRRTVFVKTWNSILIAAISFSTWQAATLFIDFIKEYYADGRLSFLNGLIGGGFQFFLVVASANMALMGLIDEYGEKAYHSIFGTLLFLMCAAYADDRIPERLLALLNMPVRIVIAVILIGSLIATIVLTIRNGFESYDKDNIRKVCISMAILAALGLFMWLQLWMIDSAKGTHHYVSEAPHGISRNEVFL